MDCSVFQYIGIFTSLYFIVTIVLTIIEGSLVTGATDGIGKETAIQLASRGQNIVLISRSEEKLRNVANEIESKHNVTQLELLRKFLAFMNTQIFQSSLEI
ncbi:very-long-chain 3-oxoacyl-CoA reductase-like [Clavelina lepadiformis]|uniref:very-long-chain 3-oxoacyl-CoA reductase-like n=1 Tax=Clavelina lepadiformis TaxID=159417 RepID=UPI0040418E1F